MKTTAALLAAVAVPLALRAAENMVGFQTQNEGFFAVPAKGEVKIDGDASDWDRSGEIQSYRDTSVKDTYSVRTSAMWDEANLYLLFVWRDPSPLASKGTPRSTRRADGSRTRSSCASSPARTRSG